MCSGCGRRGLPCGVSPFGCPRINSCYQSPRLFAVNYVLHRLMVPRHPSCARIRLSETFSENSQSSPRQRSRANASLSVYVAISTQFYSIVKELMKTSTPRGPAPESKDNGSYTVSPIRHPVKEGCGGKAQCGSLQAGRFWPAAQARRGLRVHHSRRPCGRGFSLERR